MKIVVTGAAGFIGSNLVDRLLREGHEVVGIDMLTIPEWEAVKRRNISEAMKNANFQFRQSDLLQMNLPEILKDADVVFHQAAIAGVRKSWGKDFGEYVNLNILATQRLLEACKDTGIKKFVYASSSSVYGGTDGPTDEDAPLLPISPYGVSKLAGEQLVRMYHVNYGLPTTSLRYFTVYGPRQRPDMAFHKFLKAILDGQPIPLYGNGEQTRDFTFVSDAVEANMLAMNLGVHGNVFNVGGVERASVNEILAIMQEVTGMQVRIEHLPKQPGDPLHTWADISNARKIMGYSPKIQLKEGLAAEWHYIRDLYGKGDS
ncbi:NAD-dependent epimerase/dehydratase family protein [Effusibacillus lacus]|uniref:UDP-glucose 4-epimerase n=1 Tax=Effusibacillus lacus TaxID=1348429 RepID=A0A292YU33_9BACL|nr:NAD-dependent epimerase/dehydratase family protein [Effusibacillus lacus]TCS73498.1 UDP-glucose 4-epimerase [Effusibacillus lacus]GAX92005.1 UDP-glucose 4-epimerase [Effusibacillus lacus]